MTRYYDERGDILSRDDLMRQELAREEYGLIEPSRSQRRARTPRPRPSEWSDTLAATEPWPEALGRAS